jgi:hypothetical protein
VSVTFPSPPIIPKIGSTEETMENPKTYLHYYTKTHEYLISEYDGENTMYGKVLSNVYPTGIQWQKINLSELMQNQFLKLEMAVTSFS